MFVAQALYSFSKTVLEPQAKEKQQQQPLYSKKKEQKNDQGDKQSNLKRPREKDHQEELAVEGNDKFFNRQESQQKQKQQKTEKKQSTDDPVYITFQKGEKILVQQTFENGWWYGNAIKRPELKGFFPSNYVKVGAKPPPPPPPPASEQQENYDEQAVYEPGEEEKNWMSKQLKAQVPGEQTAISSEYYQGIKGYKYVRITESNKNILNASYVKFDANTGLARVPVKDQAPCSKAVRQMGYYFDYHQWNQQRNKNPEAHRNRPDPKKKKQKKLHLVGMGKDK